MGDQRTLMGHRVPKPVGVTRTIGLEILLNHHPSRRPPPRTQLSTNREALLAGSQHSPRSVPSTRLRHWGQRCATPRQACPRPNGFGRNLRSKTRWFTGFCNSHQVSHFATFFIDARAEISVAESLLDTRVATPPARAPSPSRRVAH